MLLIVTNKTDSHADELISRLNGRAYPVFRLNTEDILDRYKIVLQIDCYGEWSGYIEDELSRVVCLEQVKVAWIRRPEFAFENPESGVDKFIVAEVRALISCIYGIPDIKFINETFDATRAKTKFQQLINAGRLGVKVPRTIFTNSSEAVSRFTAHASGDLLVKPVYTSNYEYEGTKQGLSSQRISRDKLESLKDLTAIAPTQIQDYIDKDYELRVTVIGDRVFAVKIESQLNESTMVDWRARTLLNPHSTILLPIDIATFCIKFVGSQKLVYGALDFIVHPDGSYFFLENNPSGQYLWLEHETGAAITDALINYMVSLVSSSGDDRV